MGGRPTHHAPAPPAPPPAAARALPPLIVVQPWATAMLDRAPWWFTFEIDLAQDRCVILFDRRGVAMSQRTVYDMSLYAPLARTGRARCSSSTRRRCARRCLARQPLAISSSRLI